MGATLAAVVFLAAAWPGAGSRGLIAEEVQPFLARYPHVIDLRDEGGSLVPEAWPPYEPGHPDPPRWVRTRQWPVLAYDGLDRQWPLFIRGHQTALGTYLAMGLGAILGPGLTGWRRADVLFGLALIVICLLWARRRAPAGWTWAAACLALSWGLIATARTAYAFEVFSRLAMVAGLYVFSRDRRLGPGAIAVSVALLSLAYLSRLTIVTALLPAGLVVLLRRGQDAQRGVRTVVLAASLVLPAIVLLLVAQVLSFHTGTEPLGNVDWIDFPARLLRVPDQLLLDLAWLGDALHAVWAPLTEGRRALSPWFPAFLAAIPTSAALGRLVLGKAGEGEKMYLAALAGTTLAGALVYRDSNQFQLAMAVEPLLALALAEQAAALARPLWRWIGFGLIVGLRLQSMWMGLQLDAHIANPMLSGRTQTNLVEYLEQFDPTPRLLTTSYQHAGVMEAWTDGRIHPMHAWPALSLSENQPPTDLDSHWRALLSQLHPELILLSDGENIYESSETIPRAIAASLRRVAAQMELGLRLEAAFPTESGGPGWSLWRTDPLQDVPSPHPK